MTDERERLREALHAYNESAQGGCDHSVGYGDLESECLDAAVWVERALAHDRPSGYWVIDANAKITESVRTQLSDLLPQAAAAGKQIVVVDNITLHWRALSGSSDPAQGAHIDRDRWASNSDYRDGWNDGHRDGLQTAAALSGSSDPEAET